MFLTSLGPVSLDLALRWSSVLVSVVFFSSAIGRRFSVSLRSASSYRSLVQWLRFFPVVPLEAREGCGCGARAIMFALRDSKAFIGVMASMLLMLDSRCDEMCVCFLYDPKRCV